MTKNFLAACGSAITEQHFYRNLAKDLLGGLLVKDKTLNNEAKAMRLMAARESLTKALMATPEGQNLLLNVESESTVSEFVAGLVETSGAPDAQATPADVAKQYEQLLGV